FLIIALLVKITSPGPIFYRQQRVGLDGKIFSCLKFRSMHADAEVQGKPGWTKPGDPRVTPLGKLLRRFSLDELPQLINVIKGEMSLVGPRPERPEWVEQFAHQWEDYHERHRVKVGITGWAQVNGLRGDSSIEERLRYDKFYVENWSLWFDIKILLLTILAVIKGENAY
ncbi:MAG: sugar transferase, partial [bacterium]